MLNNVDKEGLTVKEEFLMDVEETNINAQFAVEDHEATASGAGFFAFFFYYKTA